MIERRGFNRVVLVVALCLSFIPTVSAANRPFWTEKSSFVEGDELFVVGMASNSNTVEEGRKQAFENGKLELMNFAQVTSLEASGLAIETQMTFDEPQPNGTFTVYRLLRVPLKQLQAVKDNLRSKTFAQEQALAKTQQALQNVQRSFTQKQQLLDTQNRQVQQTLDSVSKLQETLTEKGLRIEQKQKEVEQLLQRLSEKVQQNDRTASAPQLQPRRP